MDKTNLQNDRNLYLKTLMVSVQAGDKTAFAKLYQQTSPLLFSVILRMIQDRNVAEEILQEAYILIWEKAGRYQADRGTVATWLVTVAKNLTIDYLRKKQLPTVPEEHAEHAEHVEDVDASPMLEAASNEARDLLLKNLSKLPENMSKAISLSYLQGYSYDEIGSLMDAPRNTVKSWIRRGVAKLRETMLMPADHLL